MALIQNLGTVMAFTLNNSSENDVFPIEPIGLGEGDEELRAVGSWPRIGHREIACAFVLHDEVFIWELRTINAFPASPVARGEVSALGHEPRDDAMEFGALESESGLAGAEVDEVSRGVRDFVVEELENQSEFLQRLISNLDVEETFGTIGKRTVDEPARKIKYGFGCCHLLFE